MDSEIEGERNLVSNSCEQADRIHDIAEKEAGVEETREFRIFGPP
jgi:hypothetical protein